MLVRSNAHMLVTKIWNAFRFIHEHVSVAAHQQPTTPLGITNEWLLDSATKTYIRYNTYLQQNEFSLALDTVEKFFWNNFCDNYLELIKDQLFKPENYTEFELTATRWTLYHTGLRILQMYAPFLPFITENLYGIIYQKPVGIPSLHQTKFAAIQTSYEFSESAATMNLIIELITQVRQTQTEKQLSLKVPIENLTISMNNEHVLHTIEAHTQLIKGITHAQKMDFYHSKRPNAATPRWRTFECTCSSGYGMISIKNNQRKIKIDTNKLKKDAQFILDQLGYSDFDLGILITTNKKIQEYNKQYRDKNKPTDVLSFPCHPHLKAGQKIKVTTQEDKNLGDLIFAPEYIINDLPQWETTFEKHLQRLLVHGICHLLGYDHIEDADYKIMHKKEMTLLKNLRPAYLDRAPERSDKRNFSFHLAKAWYALIKK